MIKKIKNIKILNYKYISINIHLQALQDYLY